MVVLSNICISGKGNSSLQINDGTIKAIASAGEPLPAAASALHLVFNQAVALPGLINSHDHLDFNLFPLLGNRVYSDYVEWGLDIHAQNKRQINAVLNIPQPLRTQWGIYKNLLNGITTVVNHGAPLAINTPPPIAVLQQCQSLHSVQLEKHWRYKLNNPLALRKTPAIHLGEGTNNDAHREINRYISNNIFNRKTVAIHGVAMDEAQAATFKALVWCPASNQFLLGRTADIDALKHLTPVVFGTDSALTASWNMWEQLRQASTVKRVTEQELLQMLTITPAALWGLQKHGALAEGMAADVVVAKQKVDKDGIPDLLNLNPEDILLVMQNGQIRLFDKTLYQPLIDQGFDMSHFSGIWVNGNRKYVEGNLPGLMTDIRRYHPTISFPVYA